MAETKRIGVFVRKPASWQNVTLRSQVSGEFINITGFTLRFGEIWWSGPHLAMAPNNSQTSSGSDWKYLAFFHFGFTQFPSLSLFLLGRRELFPELG